MRVLPPAVAILCVSSGALPSVQLAGAERLPAAAGFARFPSLPKPSQIFPILSRGTSGFVALRRDKQAFALQQYIACHFTTIYNKMSFKSLKKFDYLKFCGILSSPYRLFSAENCDRVLSPILAELS